MRNSFLLTISSSRITEWLRLEVTSWTSSPLKPLLRQGYLEPVAQDSVQTPSSGVLQVLSCQAAFWMGVPQNWCVGLFLCTSPCWISHPQKLGTFFNFFKYKLIFNFIIGKNNSFFSTLNYLLRVHCIGLSIQWD